jgi:hypothetical protein
MSSRHSTTRTYSPLSPPITPTSPPAQLRTF